MRLLCIKNYAIKKANLIKIRFLFLYIRFKECNDAEVYTEPSQSAKAYKGYVLFFDQTSRDYNFLNLTGSFINLSDFCITH